MGKLTTATWFQGALLTLGSIAGQAVQADYAPYYPDAGPYQQQGMPQAQPLKRAAVPQRVSYQYQLPAPNWQAQGRPLELAVPPSLEPYAGYQPPPQPYGYPAAAPRPRSPQAPQAYYPAPSARGYAQPATQGLYRPVTAQPRVRPTPATSKAAINAERRAVLETAYRSLGITYRWGGNTPREGFDCSGLTTFSLKKANVRVPRTALEQSRASRTISRQQLRPGDMIFFKTSGKTVNHVGIYVGDGKFIHAASGGGKVTLDDLRRSYWQKRLAKYGTFLT